MLLISDRLDRKSINSEKKIKRVVRSILEEHGSQNCEISILFTNDEEIKNLNRIYRSIDKATDVLAFSQREGIDGKLNPELLGDVVISVETAERQLPELGNSIDEELLRLTVHGVLHLLGYDHETPEEAAIMFEKQEKYTKNIIT